MRVDFDNRLLKLLNFESFLLQNLDTSKESTQ